MATSIRNMPDELLVDILGKLPKKSLKKARLVCSLWSTAGAKWMFQRVYFAPRQAWMEKFTSIAANPNFVGNVQELIYDGRLFLPELGNFASYRWAFYDRAWEEFQILEDQKRYADIPERNHADEVYQRSRWNLEKIGAGKYMHRVFTKQCQEFDMNVGNSLVRYVRLLDQQEKILTQGRDFKALCKGLRFFRNISKVSAQVDFAHCSDYMPHTNDREDDYIDGHKWYDTHSEREFGLTVPPSRWCRRPESQVGGKQDQEEHIKWDVRGVQTLFRALSMHSPTLEELRLASMYYKAPTTIFELSDTDIEKARTIFRRLTSLQLHPYVTKSDDGAGYLRRRHCLELLLQGAKELRFLSSSQWYLEDDSEEVDGEDDNVTLIQKPDLTILFGKVWPHLTELILKGVCVTKRDLMSLVRCHRVTLRTLELANILLFGEVTWEDLGLEMGKLLRLHSVCVDWIDVTYTYPSWSDRDKRSLAFVRGAMQWALPDLLEIEEDHGGGSRVVGRLKAGSS